jgi:hypothetical protein
MNTFLPYEDFDASARVLDSRRLGKQRVEARQILRVLRGQSAGWRHHPAVLIWRGYDEALAAYYNAVLREWIARGYRNSMPFEPAPECYVRPPWLGSPAVHAAYRARLLAKDPVWYGQFGWVEEPAASFDWKVFGVPPGGYPEKR